jgi:hypothetical protein
MSAARKPSATELRLEATMARVRKLEAEAPERVAPPPVQVGYRPPACPACQCAAVEPERDRLACYWCDTAFRRHESGKGWIVLGSAPVRERAGHGVEEAANG